MTEDTEEKSINTPLPLEDHFKFTRLRVKGKFSSWKAFFHWLINNKSLSETMLDEIEKQLQKKEKGQTALG